MRRLLLLCNSEVKSTFEQIFEVGAAGAENHLVDIFIYFIYIYLYILFIYMFMFIFKNHLVGSQRLPSGRQRHVHKVLIFQKAFEGICQRSLKKGSFQGQYNSSNCQEKENFVEQHFWLAQSLCFVGHWKCSCKYT